MASTGPAWISHARKLRPFIPDPRIAYCDAAGRPMPPRVLRQRNARSQILGTARQLIQEAGVDCVHMAEVAARSNVSLQTLYNLVGGRSEMLESAGCEWVEALAGRAEREASERGLNATFVTIEFFWAGAVLCQEYSQGIVNSRSSEGISTQAFTKTAQKVIFRQLAPLAAAGALIRWADVHKLSNALARTSHACVREWLTNPYDAGGFRDTLINQCGLLLRGALQLSEIGKLERSFAMSWS